MTVPHRRIVLASTSKYRRELLEKLGLPFSQVDPEYIEQAVPGETPQEKSLRLARDKARAGAERLGSDQSSIVIGSDQVAHCEGEIFSKPGNFERAHEQLLRCSGRWVVFDTSVSLADEKGNELTTFVERFQLKFRSLSSTAIERYLEMDQPFDCAGSIKAESHGVLLIAETEGQDINTLYGLPLIRLTTELANVGVESL